MPRIPTYDNLQSSPNAVGATPFQEQTGPNAQQINAQQLGEVGQGMQRAGDTASKIALSMQDQVNQTRVNDAVNKARQTAQNLAYDPASGYLNLKGDAALTRPNGQPITQEYGDKLSEQLGTIASTLGNDAQRRQFQANAADLQTQFHGQLETHMLGEFRAHALSVQDGTINLASDDAKRNWNNPDLIGPSLNAAKAAVVEKGRVSGWAASQTDAALLTTTSKVHTDVVMAALENNNPNYALSYLSARRGEMTADDILRVQGHVNQSVWAGQAMGAVQAATTAVMPKIAPTNFDRMTQITAASESNTQDFKPDGSPVTSPVGARYKMQVMPATAANPGHGIAPAANDTPAEYNRVGGQLLQALVQKYGDPGKAWAAYNWGETHVDKLLKATPDGGDWLAHTPKETQAYVAKNVKQLGSGGEIAPRPTELEFVNTALAHLPPDASPNVLKLTRDQAVQQFGIINKSATEQGYNARSAAQQWLAKNSGDYDNMPPALKDAVTQYAPNYADDIKKYADVFRPSAPEVKTDLDLYNRLASHPEEAGKMSDPQFETLKAHLAPGDFKHFANERANFLNGKTDESAGAINTGALRTSLNTRLESLGINAAPPPKDTDGRERLGGIQKFVRDSIFDAQRAAGKKFTPEEIEKHVDVLFAKSQDFKSTLFGFTTGHSSQNLMSMQIGDLPDGASEGLKKALIQSGNKTPTNNDVLNLYRKLNAKR